MDQSSFKMGQRSFSKTRNTAQVLESAMRSQRHEARIVAMITERFTY